MRPSLLDLFLIVERQLNNAESRKPDQAEERHATAPDTVSTCIAKISEKAPMASTNAHRVREVTPMGNGPITDGKLLSH